MRKIYEDGGWEMSHPVRDPTTSARASRCAAIPRALLRKDGLLILASRPRSMACLVDSKLTTVALCVASQHFVSFSATVVRQEAGTIEFDR